MKIQKKAMSGISVLMAFMAAAVFLPRLIRAGDLNPPASPGPTMKTLNQIPPTWSLKLPGADRFEAVMDGEAVLDKETGLTWTRDANLDGEKTWFGAVYFCRNLAIGNRMGWRLPTVEELSTLLDTSQTDKLPSEHPFVNVQLDVYWSATPFEDLVWAVSTSDEPVTTYDKAGTHYVWPVRGGSN
jgi:hypothetical protein